jgi:O-antigen/teichoic acid export membrane protein
LSADEHAAHPLKLKPPIHYPVSETSAHILKVLQKTQEMHASQLYCDLTGCEIAEHPTSDNNSQPSQEVATITTSDTEPQSRQSQQKDTQDMQTEITGAASNASISGIGSVLGYILKSGSTFLMQHVLDVAAFGIYSLCFSIISLVASISTFGLDDAMVRYTAIYRGKRQIHLVRRLTVFCTALAGILGIIGALVVILLAPRLARAIAAPAYAPSVTTYLTLMAPLIPLTVMQMIWLGGLQGFKDFKRRVLAQRIIVPFIVIVMLIITLIFFKHNVFAVITVTIISTIISALFNLHFLFRRIERMQAIQSTQSAPLAESSTNTYKVREWLGFSTPNFLTNIVDIMLDAIDTLLLGYFHIGPIGIGHYSAAIKISGFIAMPLTSLNAMFSPTIAELHSKGEHKKLEAMFKVVTQWAITFSLPIFCVSALFSFGLLELLSGKNFVAAWPLLIVFGLGAMANAATGSVGFMLLMTGHQKVSFLNSLVAIVINIMLGIILTPRYGVMGTAISTGLATATVNLMRLLQVHLLLKMHPYRWCMLKPLAAALLSSGLTSSALYFLHTTRFAIAIARVHIPIELTLIPVFLASYMLVLILFGASPEDQIVLNKLTKKLLRSKQPTTNRDKGSNQRDE